MPKKPKRVPQENLKAIQEGRQIVYRHPMFASLLYCGWIEAGDSKSVFVKDGFARILVKKPPPSLYPPQNTPRLAYDFSIEPHIWRRASAAEWAHVFAQAALHILMLHVDPLREDIAWRMACEFMACDLLRHLGVGERPADLAYAAIAPPGQTLEAMAEAIAADGVQNYEGASIAGKNQPGWIFEPKLPPYDDVTRKNLTDMLGAAIRSNIVAAVEQAGDKARIAGARSSDPNSMAQQARRWFVAAYPLLAALASAFDIVEDAKLCALYDIKLAAVDPEQRRIYINPQFPWQPDGMRFVIAHELLHVGLSHAARRQGRDPFLWNVACDYVINGWLIEMGVGAPPTADLLLDEALGLEKDSAEAIYDRIVKNLRLMRRLGKCMTLRGGGKPDMLGERGSAWWNGGQGCDLDSFYRRALAEGLNLHIEHKRGFLPGELIVEVRALQHPPIPWDVRLAQWLDAFFPPLERRRSFARASRRQAATPDIPRPVYERPKERMATRTFGVIVDTSGSMPSALLARGFGAIASYAISREVEFVRIVQCDAGVHDMGYVEVERLLEQIEVHGRGGTILRPAVEKLEMAADFPNDAPILIVTDGLCDHFHVRRDHAFLMPQGARLPFSTRAPVFHFEAAK